jgi:hypothetical protein
MRGLRFATLISRSAKVKVFIQDRKSQGGVVRSVAGAVATGYS